MAVYSSTLRHYSLHTTVNTDTELHPLPNFGTVHQNSTQAYRLCEHRALHKLGGDLKNSLGQNIFSSITV